VAPSGIDLLLGLSQSIFGSEVVRLVLRHPDLMPCNVQHLLRAVKRIAGKGYRVRFVLDHAGDIGTLIER
jgi:hypothetical protein